MNKLFLNEELRKPKSKRNKKAILLTCTLFVIAVVFFCCGVIFIFIQNKCSRNDENTQPGFIKNIEEYCEPSPEFVRIKLDDILKKSQKLVFRYAPQEELFAGIGKTQDEIYEIARRFKPYNPNPLHLKQITDQIEELLREIALLKPDKEKMKPKEVQILSEVRFFLEQFFGQIYDIDFYGGDWMLGPNYFCFNMICSLEFEIELFTYLFKPRSTEDIEFIISTFNEYKNTIDQYILNMVSGITAGMVRTQISCLAGADAFKQKYTKIILQGKKRGTQSSLFASHVYSDLFYSQLKDETIAVWEKNHHESVRNSVVKALENGFSQSIIRLYEYLTLNHSRYCPPDDEASGLSSLPLEYVYFDGVKNVNHPTTKVLPNTNINLDGKELYKRIVPRFTTMEISPEEIFEEGKRQLNLFYPQIKKISQEYTKQTDEEKAIKDIRVLIESSEQWHGVQSFPENESNNEAFKNCVDDDSSKNNCPVRWKSLRNWSNHINSILAMIHAKLTSVFHFTGPMTSSPNCPIKITPHYNPSNGAMYFQQSDESCSVPAEFGLPFFLEKYGPKFQEWSVVGHEGRPGHHFQYQGSEELFENICSGGLMNYFQAKRQFTGFIEGWALYAENPVLSDDVDLYEKNILQKLGMYKWQIWRAVRLVVDTGLHYRGENRTWALKQFDKFAWDNTDFGRKEVTRYMSCPGQATSYMIGRLVILKARRKAEQELGLMFSLKDFHYQILSIGQAPLDYVTDHIDRYIKCVKEPNLPYCEYILTPASSIPVKSDMYKINKNFIIQPKRYYM